MFAGVTRHAATRRREKLSLRMLASLLILHAARHLSTLILFFFSRFDYATEAFAISP